VRPPIILDHAAARDIAATSARIASELTAALDTLADDLRERRLDDYRTILRGHDGINDVLDRWLGRARLMAEP
jgi:hypothetical protein